MTVPLSDARLAEITTRLGRLHPCEGEDCCGDACKVLDVDAPDLLAEVQRLAEALTEMTRCRDAAIRYAEREHVEIEFDLDGNLRDGLTGIAEWEHPGEPDHSPDWLIDAVVRVVRPELARLTEQRDAALSLIDASAGMFGATREQLIAADEEHPTPELIEVGRRVRDQITAWLAEHDTAGGAP